MAETQIPWKRQAPVQQNNDIIREIARDAEKWDAPPQPLRSWEQPQQWRPPQPVQQPRVQVAPQQVPSQYQPPRPVQQPVQPQQPQQPRPIQQPQQPRPVQPVQQPSKVVGNKTMLRVLWGLVMLTTITFVATAIYFYVKYVRN